MRVICGNTNITNIVVVDSYKMDAEDSYVSFTDGNFVEHRTITRSKVKGEFNVVLTNKNEMPLASFMQVWDANTTNGITHLTVYVTNKGSNKKINAYCTLSNEEHKKLADGSYLDVLKITVEER